MQREGCNPSEHKCERKGVGGLHLPGVALGQGNSRGTKPAHLTVKLVKGGAALVPHYGLGNEAHAEACRPHPNAEFDVFAALELGVVAADGPKGLGAHAHVESPGVVGGGGFCGAAADAARSQYRRHGEADGLLERAEVGRGGIRAAEGVPRVAGQALGHRVKVVVGQQAVRVQKDEPGGPRRGGGRVARVAHGKPGTVKDGDAEACGLGGRLNLGAKAVVGGSVRKDDLKTAARPRKLGRAGDELAHLVGPLEGGRNQRKLGLRAARGSVVRLLQAVEYLSVRWSRHGDGSVLRRFRTRDGGDRCAPRVPPKGRLRRAGFRESWPSKR